MKIEIISSVFSDPNRMKLEINQNKRKAEKFTCMWRVTHATEQPVCQRRNKKGN